MRIREEVLKYCESMQTTQNTINTDDILQIDGLYKEHIKDYRFKKAPSAILKSLVEVIISLEKKYMYEARFSYNYPPIRYKKSWYLCVYCAIKRGDIYREINVNLYYKNDNSYIKAVKTLYLTIFEHLKDIFNTNELKHIDDLVKTRLISFLEYEKYVIENKEEKILFYSIDKSIESSKNDENEKNLQELIKIFTDKNENERQVTSLYEDYLWAKKHNVDNCFIKDLFTVECFYIKLLQTLKNNTKKQLEEAKEFIILQGGEKFYKDLYESKQEEGFTNI